MRTKLAYAITFALVMLTTGMLALTTTTVAHAQEVISTPDHEYTGPADKAETVKLDGQDWHVYVLTRKNINPPFPGMVFYGQNTVTGEWRIVYNWEVYMTWCSNCTGKVISLPTPYAPTYYADQTCSSTFNVPAYFGGYKVAYLINPTPDDRHWDSGTTTFEGVCSIDFDLQAPQPAIQMPTN